MNRIQRILVPTDFSELSMKAAGFACGLADQLQAELHFFHVLEAHASTTPVFGGGLALMPPVPESQQHADAELDRLVKSVCPSGKQVSRATAHGSPSREIVRYAQQHAIDLIVLGTHGRTGLEHVLLGSVTEKVVRGAPCPVATVRA